MSSIFKSTTSGLLKAVAMNPLLLRKVIQKPVSILHSQQIDAWNGGEIDAWNGRVNRPTSQEICFANIAERHDFKFHAKGHGLTAAHGLFYKYQPNGPQKNGDFSLCEVRGGMIVGEVIIDLRHTEGNEICMNDGWFSGNVIYLLNWNAGTEKDPVPKTHVALGQDIPTEEETAFINKMVDFKQMKNQEYTKIGSLRPYIRFSNKYNCKRFTDEVAKDHFASVEDMIFSYPNFMQENMKDELHWTSATHDTPARTG